MDPFGDTDGGSRWRGKVRPGPPNAIGMILGGIATLVVFPAAASQAGAPGGFVAFAVLIGLGSIGTGIYYLTAKRPAGMTEVDLEQVGPAARPDPGSRLRRLEQLKADGLMSEDEFAAKRAEILRDL